MASDSGQLPTAPKQAVKEKGKEVLISTKVINGKSGPPKVVTAHFW
jgi:hypothetical protein